MTNFAGAPWFSSSAIQTVATVIVGALLASGMALVLQIVRKKRWEIRCLVIPREVRRLLKLSLRTPKQQYRWWLTAIDFGSYEPESPRHFWSKFPEIVATHLRHELRCLGIRLPEAEDTIDLPSAMSGRNRRMNQMAKKFEYEGVTRLLLRTTEQELKKN